MSEIDKFYKRKLETKKILECLLLPIVMSNSWFTCMWIPPGKPMSCLRLWLSEINSGFSLYEYKYRVHEVDQHYLGTKIKMLVSYVSIERNILMYIKHLAQRLASVNVSWRSVRTCKYIRYTEGRHIMRISSSSICSWYKTKLELGSAEFWIP